MKQKNLQELLPELSPLSPAEQSELKGGYRAAPTAILERVSPRWDEIDIRFNNPDDNSDKRQRPIFGLRLP